MKTNVLLAVVTGFSVVLLILIFCAHRFIEGMSFNYSLEHTFAGAIGMLTVGLFLFWFLRRKSN
jgi:hypothetical protein